jgi:hypothetical protein
MTLNDWFEKNGFELRYPRICRNIHYNDTLMLTAAVLTYSGEVSFYRFSSRIFRDKRVKITNKDELSQEEINALNRMLVVYILDK